MKCSTKTARKNDYYWAIKKRGKTFGEGGRAQAIRREVLSIVAKARHVKQEWKNLEVGTLKDKQLSEARGEVQGERKAKLSEASGKGACNKGGSEDTQQNKQNWIRKSSSDLLSEGVERRKTQKKKAGKRRCIQMNAGTRVSAKPVRCEH